MEDFFRSHRQQAAPPTHNVPEGEPPTVTDEQAPQVDQTVADAAPPELQTAVEIAESLTACPRCKYGLLYPIGYDADAKHEAGQPIYHPQTLSGGSILLRCHSCEYQESVALNPTPAPPAPPR